MQRRSGIPFLEGSRGQGMRHNDDLFDFEKDSLNTQATQDAEAEAILLLLCSPLVWRRHQDFDRHARFYGRYVYQRADCEDGRYLLHLSRFDSSPPMYGCRFQHDDYRHWHWAWDYETDDVAVVKRACDWRIRNGEWPTEADEGWEFLKG